MNYSAKERTSAVLREPLGLDRVVTVYVVQSAQ